MKIRELYLKNFGKFSEKSICFGDGINVIYGKNEAGKTTIYNAVGAMLFGMERQRGRASQRDTYKTYQPWEYPTFYAGSMKFETGGKLFRIDRNFYQNEKSARLLCETDGEELSVEQGDLAMLLGDVTEELFFNTAAAGQLQMKPKDIVYGYLKNYIVNLQENGGGNLDVAGALENLERKRKELERQKKKRESEIRQQLAALEAKLELVDRELLDCRTQLSKIQSRKETFSAERQECKKSFWERFILWIRRLLFRKRYRTEKETFQAERIKLREKEIFFRELLGEKESLSEELTMEREALFEQLHEQSKEEEMKALALAEERIRELSSDCRAEVMEQLLKKASEVLYVVTDGKYRRLILEEGNEPEVWDGHDRRKLFQLSAGCAEQVYLAIRIAMQDLFFTEEKLPLIFDDAFAYFDEERLERLLACLEKLGRQVILLTCHRREMQLLEKNGAVYHKIML